MVLKHSLDNIHQRIRGTLMSIKSWIRKNLGTWIQRIIDDWRGKVATVELEPADEPAELPDTEPDPHEVLPTHSYADPNKVSVYASGFVWKPDSEKKKLAIVLRTAWRGVEVRMRIEHLGSLLEIPEFNSDTKNGNRPLYYGSKRGRYYPDGCELVIHAPDQDGKMWRWSWTIVDSATRYSSKTHNEITPKVTEL